MSNHECIAIPIDKETYLNNGSKIKTVSQTEEIESIIPGDTAFHEAKHVVAAHFNGTAVEMATIIPGSGYDGLTVLGKPDAVAAAAPQADGHDGTGTDKMAIIAMGENIETAKRAARSILNKRGKEVNAIAKSLQKNKTIFKSDINKAINEKEEDKESLVTISIKTTTGEETVIKDVKAKNETVMLPEWINLTNSVTKPAEN